MCDVLQGVDEAVRVVVRGVDAPLVAGMGVLGELDAVRNQVKPAERVSGPGEVGRESGWGEGVG